MGLVFGGDVVNISDNPNDDYVTSLVDTYFSDPALRVYLKAGDVLLRQGQANDRLYVLLEGCLRAEQQGEKGHTEELFQAKSHRFVGVYSFFSETYLSVMTLVAEEDCVLAYLDRTRFFTLRNQGDPLFEKFMPVVVRELVDRYHQTQELTIAREKAFDKLLETEKAASLGQMAAGVAHELNNAIAVLERNSAWMSQVLEHVWDAQTTKAYYLKGLQEGYELSSKERRQRRKSVSKRLGITEDIAEKVVELDLDNHSGADFGNALPMWHNAWKMGTSLHDVLLASRQAAHVVRSMKVLGMPSAERVPNIDINGTLQDALALSKPLLDGVDLALHLNALPVICANAGELVQVWLNLIKNACESMATVPEPKLDIRSQFDDAVISVCIEDSGAGIDPQILPHIFQPNVTTKVDGLSFGLGLGLTIVQRLVNRLQGEIIVESCPGRTCLCVRIPLEGNA